MKFQLLHTLFQEVLDIGGLIISKESSGGVSHETTCVIRLCVWVGKAYLEILYASFQAILATTWSESFKTLSKGINWNVCIRHLCFSGCIEIRYFWCYYFQIIQHLFYSWSKSSSVSCFIPTHNVVACVCVLIKETTALIP